MQPIRPSVAILFSLLWAALAAAAPVIENEAPASPPVVVELEELWRLGGEDGDYIFGVMIDASCDTEGNVYLLDHQLSHVTMVSPDGEILRDLGREGEGPGECRMPQTLTMMPDGTVAMGQRFPGKFVCLHKDGTPAASVEIRMGEEDTAGHVMLLSGQYRAGTLLSCLLHQVPEGQGQSRNSHLVRLSPKGKILHEYATHSTFLDFTRLHLDEREMVAPFVATHLVGADGRVYFTPERDRYRIEVRHPDGTPDRTITRSFDNPKRDQRTIDRMNALFEEQDRAIAIPVTWEVARLDPAINELIALPDGGLQVGHSRSDKDLPEGVFRSYDIFDAQGRWSHELHVRCEADPDNDGLIFLDDGRVLLVRGLQVARLTASGNGGQVGEETDTAVMEVICCRVQG